MISSLLVFFASVLPARAEGMPTLAAEASLDFSLPIGGLSLGPGLSLGADTPLGPVDLGAVFAARLPSSATGTLTGDKLASDVDYQTRLRVLSAAARASMPLGPADSLHARAGLDLGLAGVRQATDGAAGLTEERRLAAWVGPWAGAANPLGPGELQARLAFHVAPADLLVLGEGPGGTAVTTCVGWRQEL